MKTPAQIGQNFKQQYPGAYDQYPDEVVGQRVLLKYPSLGDSSMGDIATQAAKEATATVGGYEPGTTVNDVETNPVTQAKILPMAAGTGLAAMGVPMGASIGTGGGNLLADAALKTYGRSDQIPPVGKQVLNTGLAALGDLTAIPAINRKLFGAQVGSAEEGYIPPVQERTNLPQPAGPQPVSNAVQDTVNMVNDPNTPKNPAFWQQVRNQVKWLYDRGKNEVMSGDDKGKLQWLNGMAQDGLNSSIPGRAGPAASLAMSQTVPNTISNAAPNVPWWLKTALAVGGGGALEKALGGVGSGH